MGAIAAAVVFDGAAASDVVRSMLRAAPHRGARHDVEETGPCAIGISSDDGFALATLARDGSWTAAVVGNVDNWTALAADLVGTTGGRVPDSAASMLIMAFRAWGANAVRRLRGAFAGVLWDGDVLWCFRDQVGFQPLFYRLSDRAFYCASEAKQVVRGAGLDLEPNHEALEVLFYRGTGDDTALTGVKRFRSSALARVDRRGRMGLDRYWDPSPLVESARIRLPEARERLVALLDQAVQRTVTGRDVITLSGGIDSPTVAAFAAPAHLRRGGRALQALNTSYPDFPSVEEGGYARQVADFLGISMTTHVLSGSPLSDLEMWTRLVDGPWDTLPMPVVVQTYRLAREMGARTVLTGELAEYVYTLSRFMNGHLFLRGRWRALGRNARAMVDGGRSWSSFARGLLWEVTPGTIGNLYMRLARRRSHHFPQWIDPGALGGSPFRRPFTDWPHRRWRRAQVAATRGTTSTLEADEIAGAVCGVRVRRPLADVDLWEFFISLPAEVKFPTPVPKALVRQAMAGRLPESILNRRSKTLFDEYVLGTADFPALLRWTDPSQYRMRGVDYTRLRAALEARRVTVGDLQWAYDLAKVHAFAGQSAVREGEDTSFGVYTGIPAG